MGKTIIVSNRLPISVNRKNDGFEYQPSCGGLATGLGSIYSKKDNIWIGWPGGEIKDPDQKLEITRDLNGLKMAPVFLTQQEIEEFYEGFSNETLWPAFHYFCQYVSYGDNAWEAYVKVNEKFCEAILEKAEPDDTVWVHDYHLLLLPQLLKEKLPNLTIAFFQHIPFPSYEIFRILPWREKILRGMCGADLIGFHTYDDTRHFLSSVNRILGYSHESGYIRTENHLINVDSFPMGIDYEKFEQSATSPETKNIIAGYKEILGDQKLLLSIDRLDYSKGIPQRLRAYDLFLQENPDQREKVSLIMIVVPSREQVKQYQEIKEEIDTLVGRINSDYSTFDWTPVHYFYRSFPLAELSAFYSMSDIALVTPLRDGMNLVCKEFIASKTDKKGVLILSEMAGASKELQDALLVNPNDISEVSQAIQRALVMDEEEQIKNLTSMQKSLRRYDIFQWVNVFMGRLAHVKRKQAEFESKSFDETGFEILQNNFQNANKPIVLLDYDGTLVGYKTKPEEAFPDNELKSVIHQLAQNALVVIISGRDRETLNHWFYNYPVNIMAEHGLWIKRKDLGEGWRPLTEIDNSWKPNIREIMDYYVLRTPGAFVEEKNNSLVWHYRQAENGLGNLRMREMFCHLKYIARGNNLQVLEGDMFLEIKRPDTNKSKAAMDFIKKERFDFILAIGDHWTDEETFKVLPKSAFSIRVGYRYTQAKYNIPSYKEVKALLSKLIKVKMSKLESA